MAQCSRCGAETEMYFAGYPLCVTCSDVHDKETRKAAATAHNRLNDFLTRRIVPEDLKRSG
jgi:hypothetical protein